MKNISVAIAKGAPPEERGKRLDLGKVEANGLWPINAGAGHLFRFGRIERFLKGAGRSLACYRHEPQSLPPGTPLGRVLCLPREEFGA
jgi:hypothetical protein